MFLEQAQRLTVMEILTQANTQVKGETVEAIITVDLILVDTKNVDAFLK